MMFENNVRNKYDINDVLYVYNTKANKIDTIKVFAITLKEDDEEVMYNYVYYQHEVFAIYEECFKYARQYLYSWYMEMDKMLKNNSKEGEGNASS